MLVKNEFKEYISHWENIYRTVEANKAGTMETNWENKGDDHFVHATIYWWMALQRTPRMNIGQFQALDSRGFAIVTHEILDGKVPASKIPMLAYDDSLDDESWLY